MRFYFSLIVLFVFGLNTSMAAFACGCGCKDKNCGAKAEAPIKEKLYCEETKKIIVAQTINSIENGALDSDGCKGNCNNGGK
ncbi:MAG: hypothetical protein A3B68_05000 [Candidatus Melainabacteria bacterium RIFCSPHIGHO2_02_FULL_34_12]|nr:MAG: hypothetical protein A3B68_05000 [Candidatus Melainabacteria bacterium RIFCSPHIGHO2_02_FULL_34_12]